MTDPDHERLLALESRLAQVESALAQGTRSSARRRLALLLGVGVLPALAYAGWTMAAGEVTLDDLIKRSPGGTIQIAAPFEVIGSDGRAILGVSESPGSAAVSVSLTNGAGLVSTRSASGAHTAAMGMNTNGYGTVFAYDGSGKPRAFLQGSGAVFVQNEKSEQVALLGSIDGKGAVGVWAGGQRVIAMTESSEGAGALTVYDKGHQEISLLTQSDGQAVLNLKSNGNPAVTLQTGTGGDGQIILSDAQAAGTLFLLGGSAGKKGTISLRESGYEVGMLGINETGSGELDLNTSTGNPALVAEGSSVSRPGHGGVLLVYNSSAEVVASVGATEEGNGLVAVQKEGKALANMGVDVGSKGGALFLYDETNKPGGKAIARSDGSSIIAYSNAGDLAASVAVSPDGKGQFTAFDGDNSVAELWAADGAGRLVLRAADGKDGLQATAGAQTGLVLFNTDEEPVIGIGPNAEGRGAVDIVTKGNTIAELTADGAGAVIVNDGSGAAIAKMEMTADGRPQVIVTGPGGNEIYAVMSKDPEGGGGILQASNGRGAVGTLMATKSGGGYLQIISSGGATAVEAGANSEGVGVVRVGPRFKCAAGGMGLQIPDCIVGLP